MNKLKGDSLTFLDHTTSHGKLRGVIGGSTTFHLPGIFLSRDELFPILDGHVYTTDSLALQYRISDPLQKQKGQTLNIKIIVNMRIKRSRNLTKKNPQTNMIL